MTPLIFAVLLILALALLGLALLMGDSALGVGSASVFFLIAALLFSEGVSDIAGKFSTFFAVTLILIGLMAFYQFALGGE